MKLSEALDAAIFLQDAADAAREMEQKQDVNEYQEGLQWQAIYDLQAALEKAKEPEKLQCAGCHKWVDRTHFTHEMTCFDPPKPSGWRAREGYASLVDGSRAEFAHAVEIHPEARRWWRCKDCGRTFADQKNFPPEAHDNQHYHWKINDFDFKDSRPRPAKRFSEVLEISREEP